MVANLPSGVSKDAEFLKKTNECEWLVLVREARLPFPCRPEKILADLRRTQSFDQRRWVPQDSTAIF